jgi:site-specific recombinase XerD
LNRLFDWLVSQNIVLSSPVQAKPKPTTSHKDPYIFSSFQVQQILKEAERLPDNQMAPLRGRTYRMIFSLLYALGMRVGEVARLEFRDVDVDRELLVIRETKFAKTRLVPYGPRVSEALRSYINQQQEYYGQLEEDQPLFSFRRKQKLPVCPTTISGVVHKLVLELNFNVPPGVTTPHLHCLRHSFAVNTLLRWYQTGDDPAGKLIHLSTFMGHVSPSSTAVYLTITNDFLECANEYFERFARQTIKGGLS